MIESKQMVSLFENKLPPILSQYWKRPSELLNDISNETDLKQLLFDYPNFNITGEPNCMFFYCYNEYSLLLYSLRKEILTNPFVHELEVLTNEKLLSLSLKEGFLLKFNLNTDCFNRLKIPKLFLINLFHAEMYPTPRLTLGISYIASYIRQYNLADVEIIDFQFNANVKNTKKNIYQNLPHIIGLSVNFGQLDLLESFILEIRKIKNYKPVIVLGNVLSALCCLELLSKYPEVIICQKEGEVTMKKICESYLKGSDKKDISGIKYFDKEQKRIVSNQSVHFEIETLPIPALDTIEDLFKKGGVITAEFSRGCQYNLCTFCPRLHKGAIYRSFSPKKMLSQWIFFYHLLEKFNQPKNIFLADEEFIGNDFLGSASTRLNQFCSLLEENNFQIKFDASCRGDQLLDTKKTIDWHIERGKLFKRLKKNGLNRLFLGVESGSNAQLARYKKGYNKDDIISSIRYFSLLGINLRFGFIFFDPLMTVTDIHENIMFLGRKDIVFKPSNDNVNKIYEFVRNNHGKIIESRFSKGNVYNNVSYMVSPLEVLIKSSYLREINKKKPNLIQSKEINFARVNVNYENPSIGLICDICNSWINHCFPVIYTIKGLRKNTSLREELLFFDLMKKHRQLSYFLIRSLVELFSLVNNRQVLEWDKIQVMPLEFKLVLNEAELIFEPKAPYRSVTFIVKRYIKILDEILRVLDVKIQRLDNNKSKIWKTTYNEWKRLEYSFNSQRRTK